MTTFQFVTAKQNFLPRPASDDDVWEINSDLVARVKHGSLDVRLVVAPGALRFKRLPHASRARAASIRPRINALGLSQRVKDDLFILALHEDGYPHLRLETLKLRVLGYLRRPFTYAKVGG